MDNILKLSIISLSIHLSFIPPWAPSRVAFQLLTEWKDSSERSGPGSTQAAAPHERGSFSLWGLQTGLASISQVERRVGWAAPAGRRPGGFGCHEHTTDWVTRRPGASQVDGGHAHTPPSKTQRPLSSGTLGTDSEGAGMAPCRLRCEGQISPIKLVYPCFSLTAGQRCCKINFTFLLLTTSAHCNYRVVNVKINYGRGN